MQNSIQSVRNHATFPQRLILSVVPMAVGAAVLPAIQLLVAVYYGGLSPAAALNEALGPFTFGEIGFIVFLLTPFAILGIFLLYLGASLSFRGVIRLLYGGLIGLLVSLIPLYTFTWVHEYAYRGVIPASRGDSSILVTQYLSLLTMGMGLLLARLFIDEPAENRISTGRCPQCKYDLTGNESGRCPECGSELAPESPT